MFAASTATLVIAIALVLRPGHGGQPTGPRPSASRPAHWSAPPAISASGVLAGPVGTTFTAIGVTGNGQTIEYSVTLNKVTQRARPGNPRDRAPAGRHLAAAEFTVKGIKGTVRGNANTAADAIGAGRRIFQAGSELLAAGLDFNAGHFTMTPGSTVIGWVSFEVPDGARITSVQWDPSDTLGGIGPATWRLAAKVGGHQPGTSSSARAGLRVRHARYRAAASSG